MSTLLLRFTAPMQSWGLYSKFEHRSTEREPTKSGVIGFLAAAMGIRRDDEGKKIDELREQLRIGVRVDREGVLLNDFHIAQTENNKDTYLTNRKYLCDAVFVIGIEGSDGLLSELADAIQSPAFPLFLGRRSCPPTGKIVLGIRDLSLEDALDREEKSPGVKAPENGNVRFVIEVREPEATSFFVPDDPLSLSRFRREYGFRSSKEYFRNPIGFTISEAETDHNPFAELDDLSDEKPSHDPMAELEEPHVHDEG